MILICLDESTDVTSAARLEVIAKSRDLYSSPRS